MQSSSKPIERGPEEKLRPTGRKIDDTVVFDVAAVTNAANAVATAAKDLLDDTIQKGVQGFRNLIQRANHAQQDVQLQKILQKANDGFGFRVEPWGKVIHLSVKDHQKQSTTPSPRVDKKEVTQPLTPEDTERVCLPSEFQCAAAATKAQRCVPSNRVCDSVHDCSDGSDENGCQEIGCKGNFQCSDGMCLGPLLVCNGIRDCKDGSDELGCASQNCSSGFLCDGGSRCLDLKFVCDGKRTCLDGTDELGCKNVSCNNERLNRFQCRDGSCINRSYLCDGEKDCLHGEDEENCQACPSSQFRCPNGECIKSFRECDGIPHCPSGADEEGCIRIRGTDLRIKRSGRSFPVCWDHWSEKWSDEICRRMGRSKAIKTRSIEVNLTESSTSFRKLLLLHPNAPADPRTDLSKALFHRSHIQCPSSSLVQLECEDNVCGRWNDVDVDEKGVVSPGSNPWTSWPSVATLLHVASKQFCTASILSPMHVLSSRSCMQKWSLLKDDWFVLAGSGSKDPRSSQLRLLSEIKLAPRTKERNGLTAQDLVIATMNEPLEMRHDNVMPVCLPGETEKVADPYDLMCVTAVGGMNNGGAALSQTVKFRRIFVMDRETCNSTEHLNGQLRNSMLCAVGSKDEELCRGDLGASLSCWSTERRQWELLGVLSNPMLCGNSEQPSIYASVGSLRSWIQQSTGLDSIFNPLQ
ncbi:unnamed protein product [Cyprideis torosa]|uniref:Uncharacterized protein n=1 Tax=Cyprideis torosa TaxID=163714 RepID=A0A7R8ZUU4_9CRUS|nr:unnamed protein product [Cyprideis torosa]CAG0901008.1 unnamed protein product [Cyprideis torosa]